MASQSSALHSERPARTSMFPALVAVGVKLVHAAVAVAGDQGVAVDQTNGAVGIGDVAFPVDLAGPVDLLHLADAAEGDEVAAVAQALDAAPGQAGADA